MSTLRSSHAPVRKSLPLSERDLADLNNLRVSGAHRAALARLADAHVPDNVSEAGLLHAVWEAGMRAVRQQVEEEGYAQIAAELDEKAAHAVARRRRPAWADE